MIKHSVSTKKNGVSVQWTSDPAVDSSVDKEMVMQYTLHMYMYMYIANLYILNH